MQCGRSNSVSLCGAEQERRMRGKNRMQQRFFPAGAKFRKARFFRVDCGNARQVFRRPRRRNQASQAHSAALQRFAFHFGDKTLDIIEIKATVFQQP